MSLICQERNTKYEYLRFLVEWWNLIRRDYKFNVIMPTQYGAGQKEPEVAWSRFTVADWGC